MAASNSNSVGVGQIQKFTAKGRDIAPAKTHIQVLMANELSVWDSSLTKMKTAAVSAADSSTTSVSADTSNTPGRMMIIAPRNRRKHRTSAAGFSPCRDMENTTVHSVFATSTSGTTVSAQKSKRSANAKDTVQSAF